jgi:circadian clock protein KaiB
MKEKKVSATTRAFEEALATDPKREYYHLLLFVSGSTPRSLRSIENIKRLCEESLHDRYSIEVVDAYLQPDRLKPEQILVTPTLIKKLPSPIRRIVGDLSDKERVLIGLDIIPRPIVIESHGGSEDGG